MISGVLRLILAITCAASLSQPGAADADDSAAACKPADPTGPAADMHLLSEQDAIDRAEAFVMANGYTSIPGNPAFFQKESVERRHLMPDILALRRDTLKPRAYGVFPKQVPDGVWTIVFEFRHPLDPGTGRAVTLDACGQRIRMQHQGIFLKNVRRTNRPQAEGDAAWLESNPSGTCCLLIRLQNAGTGDAASWIPYIVPGLAVAPAQRLLPRPDLLVVLRGRALEDLTVRETFHVLGAGLLDLNEGWIDWPLSDGTFYRIRLGHGIDQRPLSSTIQRP